LRKRKKRGRKTALKMCAIPATQEVEDGRITI
jgi:hypothetical protein